MAKERLFNQANVTVSDTFIVVGEKAYGINSIQSVKLEVLTLSIGGYFLAIQA